MSQSYRNMPAYDYANVTMRENLMRAYFVDESGDVFNQFES